MVSYNISYLIKAETYVYSLVLADCVFVFYMQVPPSLYLIHVYVLV